MKEKDSPKLTKKASSNHLLRTVSKLVVLDTKLKTKVHQKAASVKSSLAKKKAKADSADGKKGVTFAEETKPPEDPQEQDEDFLPTIDDENAEGGEEKDDSEKTDQENKENAGLEGEEGENQNQQDVDENGKTGEEDEDGKKGGKKGKKKGKSKKDKKEEARKRAAAKKEAEQPVGEVTVGKEHFRSFIFEKVQDALSIVCTDGVTAINVDNVQPLLKSLDLDPSQEGVMDLIKDSLIDHFGEMNPLDLDRVVQEAQEANELNEMDDCLEVAFKVIDFDEDGFITQADIYQLMLRLGEMLADYALDDMLDAVDMDKDGKISLRDFRYFLLGRDVPSRKEVFAMAAEAKKKREEAEMKAEEEAERQKMEMLKSGQCAPEKEADESSELDGQTDATLSQGQPSGGKVEDGEGGEKVTPQEINPPQESETLKEGDQINSSPTENSGQSSESLEHSGSVGVDSEIKSPADDQNYQTGEAQEIQEKREHISWNTDKTNQSSTSPGDEPTPSAEPVPNQQESATSLGLDSLSLPLGAEGGSRSQQRRPSCASSTGASDDDYDFRSRSPIPLMKLSSGETGTPLLEVPPPDLSAVEGHPPSPMPTPLGTPVATPRRRPTIVGIGGLAVEEGGESGMDQSYVDAIEVLRQQMLTGKEGNAVPDRPHRRRNSRHSVTDLGDTDGLNTVQDVEDFNNRLVFKLPSRRRSSTVPFHPSSRRNSRDESDAFKSKQSERAGDVGGADSDEGIGLADEDVIVKSVYVASRSQAPPPGASSLLRISLPSGDSAEPWGEHVPKPGALPPPTVTVEPLNIAEDNPEDTKADNSKPGVPQQKNQWLGVSPCDDAESPRSIASRSEFSAMNTSLTSPRTDDGGSENDDLGLLLTRRSETSDGRMSARRPMSGQTLPSARSVQSEYECDADSVIFSITEDAMSVSSNQRHVKYALDEETIGESEDGKTRSHSPSIKSGGLTPTKPSTNSKASQKASIPCKTIELKELDLKSPITADQFSNRKRFGMIPRDVSKFLVLGKTPAYADSALGVNTPRSEQQVTPRGPFTSRKLSPALRLSSQRGIDVGILRQRPQTAITHRERDILQNRRISLMEDEILPLYDPHRDFDSPNSLETGGGSNAIEITTPGSGRRTSETDHMAQLKQMERRILKRSKTTFDLGPVQEGSTAPSAGRPISGRAIKERAASASLLQRQQTTPRLLSSGRLNSARSDEDKDDTRIHGKSASAADHTKGPFSRSVVPLTRVVMAYQNVRKRRQSREFYSLSRELERSGKPLYSSSKQKQTSSPYALDLSSTKSPRSGKKRMPQYFGKKHSGRRSSSRSILYNKKRIGAEEEFADFPAAAAGDDVPTLVGDLSDPDVIPDDVIFEKYRPHTTGGYRHRHKNHSSILTLELPKDACHNPKVKSVSLLSKLPIK